MTAGSFNLIDEAWIRVRTNRGRIDELSLRRVLHEASELRSLAGEVASQDVAILRMLLAVLLGASRPDEALSDKEARELFSAWRSANAFPPEMIDGYLDLFHSRFNLIDPTAPFLQVATLTTGSGNRSGLVKLLADVPDGHRYFTTRSGKELESLSLAEAARWLVHCQAFDPAGIKTGALGDPRVKGGKGYSFGYPAWAGCLGPVITEGATLFDTLLFNLPLQMAGPGDLPQWERAPLGPTVEVPAGQAIPTTVIEEPARQPTGPADAFTWPSRRMRLFTDGDRVVDVQISNGDKLTPENRVPIEPMTAWRMSKNKSKGSVIVHMPVTYDGTMRIWQGLAPLLQRSNEPTATKPAHTIAWLSYLRAAGAVATDEVVNLRTVSPVYGAQNSSIVDVVDDRLAARVVALTDPTIIQAAIDAATAARAGVIALANFAGNLDRAAGGDGHARDRTFELGYAALDHPFRQWIMTLDTIDSLPLRRETWDAKAFDVLRRAGAQLARDAGSAAFVGRPVSQVGTDARQHLDAGLAENWFRGALHKAFPGAHATRPVSHDPITHAEEAHR